MDSKRVEGNWKQFNGKVKEKWSKLTHDLKVINRRSSSYTPYQDGVGVAVFSAQPLIPQSAGSTEMRYVEQDS
jgi:hypothetical protein